MAWVLNNGGNPQGYSFTSHNEFIYELKEALKAQGWTVPQSGTGTSGSYDASDLITDATVLTGARAWFEIRDPDGVRSFTFQRITNNANWRVKYAATGGFAAGNENTTGAANMVGEEIVFIGSGTDASPSGMTWGSPSGSKYGIIGCQDAAPWGFFAHARAAGTGSDDSMVFMDPMLEGTYTDTDTDPVVIGIRQSPASQIWMTSIWNPTSAGGAACWLRKASGSGGFQTIGSVQWWGGGTTTQVLPKNGGTDPESGEDISVPMVWIRNPSLGAPSGWKGISSIFEVNLASRSNGDTVTRSTTRDRIVLSAAELLAPWNGTLPLV